MDALLNLFFGLPAGLTMLAILVVDHDGLQLGASRALLARRACLFLVPTGGRYGLHAPLGVALVAHVREGILPTQSGVRLRGGFASC